MTDDELTLIARLRALLELLPPALDRHVAALGLTSDEFALLERVDGAEGGRLRLSRLASSTNATLPRLSRVMNGLERKGLVSRAPCKEDARATDAVLTAAGRELVRQARPIMDVALRRTVIAPLTGDQLRAASSAIYAILQVLDPEGRLAVTAEPS